MATCETFQPDPPPVEIVLTLSRGEAWTVRDALYRLNTPMASEIHRVLAQEMDGTK